MENERLISINEAAEMLGTTPHVARDYLGKAGLQPIFLGRGRSRGCRWLHSAVLALITTRFAEAQTQGQEKRKRITKGFSFSGRSVEEIYNLTRAHTLQ